MNDKSKKIKKIFLKQIRQKSINISKKNKENRDDIEILTKESENISEIQNLKNEYHKAIIKAESIKDDIVNKLSERAKDFEDDDIICDNNVNKKKFTILGYKPWRLMAYFVLYSFLGFCLETVYGLLTKGVLESRKSFLYGPFCSIYGLGAIVMILSLQYFKKNNYTLFFGGYIVGSLIEYFVSLFGEMMLHVKWWDYSNEPFNINGRVCLFYSIAWGLLAIYLIRHINPLIDKLIHKINSKIPKITLPIIFDILTAYLLVDCIISCIAMNVFYSRIVYNYDLDINNSEIYKSSYERRLKNEKWFNFCENHFSNEKMVKTYPNLKFEDKEGNIILIRNILNDIKPYYIKLFTPDESKNHLTNVETVNYEE